MSYSIDKTDTRSLKCHAYLNDDEPCRRRQEKVAKSVQVGSQNYVNALRLVISISAWPQLGRSRVDTLNGSRHANMKELRFDAADGVWRVAFAFDPKQQAVLLVSADKSGGSEKRFYRQLIAKADERFDDHLLRSKKHRRK